jgi:hypothetical protein
MRKQKNQAANSVEASSSICRRLKKAIADSGLTCYSIAKDAGVAPSVVYRWVKGQRSISLETADRLAGSLRLRPEREAPSVAVIPEEERSVTAMVSNGKHSPSTPTGNVKPNIGIGPYSPGMTATGSDTEELGARCMRLQAVFAYALALAKASVKSWDCDLKCNVHNLDDHEGDLTVTWNVEPTNAERRFFEVACRRFSRRRRRLHPSSGAISVRRPQDRRREDDDLSLEVYDGLKRSIEKIGVRPLGRRELDNLLAEMQLDQRADSRG